MKEYDDFKQFIKNEIVKAVDEEDIERVKYLVSALELMAQMKQKTEIVKPGTTIKKAKEVKPKSKVTEKKTIEKSVKKVGKQGRPLLNVEKKALHKVEKKTKKVIDSKEGGGKESPKSKKTLKEEKTAVIEEVVKKKTALVSGEFKEKIEVPARGMLKEKESIGKEKKPVIEETGEKTKLEKEVSSGKRLPFTGKLVKGLKTPQSAYIFPLLDTLMEFNGSAPYATVTQSVFEKMKGIFNNYDLSPVTHNKYIPRWKDTLKWVKVELVERGILERNTEKGIWAISEYGKAYYAQHKDKLEGVKGNLPSSEESKEYGIGGDSQQSKLEEVVSDNTQSSVEIQEQGINIDTSQLMPEQVNTNITESSDNVNGQAISSDLSHSEPEQNSQ